MKHGTKTKTTVLKILEKEKNKDRINLNEPKIAVAVPDCPAHLNTYAKKEWKRITPILERMGLITHIDMAALAGYCQAYGRWIDAEKNIKKLQKRDGKDAMLINTPKGYVMINPYISVANKSMELMYKFMVEFGLTPSSRTRISVKSNEDNYDDFEKLLNKQMVNG